MARLVFLVEELSARVLLDVLLPRWFPSLRWLCVSHDGKADLRSRIPSRLSTWPEPGARFAVLHDGDGGDCLKLKRSLKNLCGERRRPVLIRIACQEIEAWYLGEPDALAEAFGDDRLRAIGQKSKFRDPDSVPRPAETLRQLVPGFQKTEAARQSAPYLTRERNRSRSFRAFVAGVEAVAAEMAAEPPGR